MSKITPEMVEEAMDNQYDGIEDCVLVEEILQLKAELATAKEKNRWTPVEEGLPDKMTAKQCKALEYPLVLVVNVKVGNSVVTAFRGRTGRFETIAGWDYQDGEITHWKPIILPVPKENEE